MCRYLPKDFGESGSSLYDHVESHAVGLATLRVFPRVGSPYSCTMSQKYSHNCDLSLNTRRTDSIPSWCYCSWYLWCSPRQEKTCSSFLRLDVSSFKSLSFDSAGNTWKPWGVFNRRQQVLLTVVVDKILSALLPVIPAGMTLHKQFTAGKLSVNR